MIDKPLEVKVMPERKTPYEAFGVQCGVGWRNLYQPLIDLCQLYEIQILQVKEKFGGLRFYIGESRKEEVPDLCHLIHAAEIKSFQVCENCGTQGMLRYDVETNQAIPLVTTGPSETSGWIRSLCPDCRTELDNRRRAETERMKNERATATATLPV